MLYSLNHIIGVIDGFRWAILSGDSQIHWPSFAGMRDRISHGYDGIDYTML